MEQRIKIKDLQVGENFMIPVVLNSVTPLKTRAGKDYLAVEAFDGIDSIKGNYWDWSGAAMPSAHNTVYTLQGQVTTWEGVKQLKIISINTNKDYKPEDFLPQSGQNVEAAYDTAKMFIDQYVTVPFLHTLSTFIFDHYKEQLLLAPGAKGVHHAFVGGTLIHSVETANIALGIVDNLAYPIADKSLVVAGALLHDIGKIFAYDFEGATPIITADGMLKDHSYLGAHLVELVGDDLIKDEHDASCLQLLTHIILSHHGTLEYGAIVTPACMEAFIVSASDDLDAKAEIIRTAGDKTSGMFTDRIWAINNRPVLNYKSVANAVNDGNNN